MMSKINSCLSLPTRDYKTVQKINSCIVKECIQALHSIEVFYQSDGSGQNEMIFDTTVDQLECRTFQLENQYLSLNKSVN